MQDVAAATKASVAKGNRIGFVTRFFHWSVAVLLLGPFLAAWAFNVLGPSALAAQLVEVHRSTGLVILSLVVLRLLWRWSHPLPPLPGTTAPWERWLAGTVQFGLYACLLVMPLLGWIGSNAQGDTVTLFGFLQLPEVVTPDQNLGDSLFALHEVLGFVILGLVALHVAGALRHRFVKGDEVLQAMISGGHSQ